MQKIIATISKEAMFYIDLPVTPAARRLSFYLAMEEYVARRIDADDCFFMWQVAPSVIFGRNQELESEVNVDYCRQHQIQLYRRKSGGGCVYADEKNVMLSYVTSGEKVDFAFHRFINMMLLVFRKMGIDAVGTSHNDILIDGKKVCGTACYHLPGKSIVHSTMLYDTDMEHMLHAITPSQEKLHSKGNQSVRQRITFLKNYTTLGLEDVVKMVRQTLCTDTLTLTEADVAAIEQIEETYLREDFIHLL